MFYPELNKPNLQVWTDTKRRTFTEFKRESTPSKYLLPLPGVTLPATLLPGSCLPRSQRRVEGIHINVQKLAGNASFLCV